MYKGFWQTTQDILQQFGVTGSTAIAVSVAFASPTRENIEAVNIAFDATGATPPPELMEALWGRYYDAIASNPIYTGTQLASISPWIFGGIAVLFIFGMIKKRRR